MKSRAEKRADVMTAAGNLFVQYGFENTSVRDIAQNSDIGLPTFYRLFKSKRDLFDELIGERVRMLWERCLAAAAEGPAEQRLEATIRTAARTMFEDDLICAALQYWFSPANEDLGQAHLDRLVSTLSPMAEALDQGLADIGLSQRRDPMATFGVVTCALFGYCGRRELWRDRLSIDRVADALIFLISSAGKLAGGAPSPELLTPNAP